MTEQEPVKAKLTVDQFIGICHPHDPDDLMLRMIRRKRNE